MDAAKDVEGVRSAYETVKTVSEENTKAKEAAEQLAKAKADAVNTVNGYEHLSAEQKADYIAKIKAARNTTELEAAKKKLRMLNQKLLIRQEHYLLLNKKQ